MPPRPSVPVSHSPGSRPMQRNSSAASANGGGANTNKTSIRKKSQNVKASLDDSATRSKFQNDSGTSVPQSETDNLNSAAMANSSMLGATGTTGMFSGGMMMGSPYASPYGYGGMMPGGMMPDMAFSGLNRFLFGVQSIIFSLGQAVQIMGMNTQALRQLLDTASAMFDHALAAWKEMRALEVAAHASESEEDKKKRRRLKTLRWTMMVGLSYALYKLIRRVLFPARRRMGALGNGSHHLPLGYDGSRMLHGETAGYGSGGYGSYGSSHMFPSYGGGGGYAYNSSPYGPGSGSYPGYY